MKRFSGKKTKKILSMPGMATAAKKLGTAAVEVGMLTLGVPATEVIGDHRAIESAVENVDLHLRKPPTRKKPLPLRKSSKMA